MIADSQPVSMNLESEGSSARQELWSVPRGSAAFLGAIVNHLLLFIEKHAPLGYEDHSGFHYGNEPR